MNSSTKKQTKLRSSLEKYGVQPHIFDVVEECDLDSLRERERYWQEFYDVLGDGGLNRSLVNTKDKKGYSPFNSERNSGKGNPMYGKSHTQSTKEKISLSNKGKLAGSKNPMYGKKRPEIALRNMLISSKKVKNTQTGEVFTSIKQAAMSIGMKNYWLQSRLKGVTKNETYFVYFDEI